MKKFLVTFLAASVVVSGFAGCSKGVENTESNETSSEENAASIAAQKERLKEAYATKNIKEAVDEIIAEGVTEAVESVEQAIGEAVLEEAADQVIKDVALEEATKIVKGQEEEHGAEEGTEHADENNAAVQALSKLLAGNSSYLSGIISPDISGATRSDLVANGQHPYAIVITCSDSRVPAELIFDAGLGELFVIRTAGNVVGDFEIGSVEYGAEHLGSPLIFVLGHSNCGAVTAATEAGEAGGKIQDIVNEITPSVQKAREKGEDKLLARSIKLNVKNSINRLMQSEIIHELHSEGKVAIIGGVYDIETGSIKILD